MTPGKTPAERLRDALTAAHDAAYTEAFRASLDALERLAMGMGGRFGKRQESAIRGAYIALAEGARRAATGHLVQGQYEPALLSYPCGERLAEMAKERCGVVLGRLGGGK